MITKQVWEHAKLLYTNDTQRLYDVCQSLLNIVSPDTLMVQWRNICVKFMLFFMISMSYCLLSPLLLKN